MGEIYLILMSVVITLATPPPATPPSQKPEPGEYPTRGFFADVTAFGDRIVLKSFAGTMTRAQATEFAAMHEKWVTALRSIGIHVHETALDLTSPDGQIFSLALTQDRIPRDSLCRHIAKTGGASEVREIGLAILEQAIKFLQSDLPAQGMGFHPSVRNTALVNGKLVMFDTFPPLISHDQAVEVAWQHFPSSGLGRIVRLMPDFLGKFAVRLGTGESFDAVRMVLGPAHTLCRMRPDLAPMIRSAFWHRLGSVGTSWADEACNRLTIPFRETWYHEMRGFLRNGSTP